MSVSTLPTEVLLKILNDVILSQGSFHNPATPDLRLDPLSGQPLPREDAKSSYRSVEQVCQWWREVVLACPSIWIAKIDELQHTPINSSWWDELYRRSEPLPCPIYITYHAPESTATYLSRMHRIGKDNIHRLRAISLRVHHAGAYHEHYAFTRASPLLEDLQIRNPRDGNPPAGISFDGELHEACRLKVLCLVQVTFHSNIFESDCYRQLRNLTIYLPRFAKRPTTGEWLKILDVLPVLESLTIEYGDWLREDIIHSPRAETYLVYMKHLNYLFLSNDCCEISELLSYLVIPQGCSLHLKVFNVVAGHSFLTLAAYLHRRLLSCAGTIHQLSTSWYYTVWPDGLTVKEIADSSSVSMRRFGCSFRPTPEGLLKDLLAALEPITLSTRTLKFDDKPSIIVIAGLLPRFTFIAMLMEVLTLVEHVVIPHRWKFPFDRCMDDANSALPNLTKLTFESPEFGISALPQDFIRWRRQVGLPLKEVSLMAGLETMQLVEQVLRDIAPEIHVTSIDPLPVVQTRC